MKGRLTVGKGYRKGGCESVSGMSKMEKYACGQEILTEGNVNAELHIAMVVSA